MMRQIKMKLTDDIEGGRAVLAPTFRGPAVQGEASGELAVQYICANCKQVLATKVELGQVNHLVIKCTNCGRHNQC